MNSDEELDIDSYLDDICRTCSKCGETKPLNMFYKNNNSYRTACKKCFMSKQDKAKKARASSKYRLENYDKVQARRKQFRIENREKLSNKHKEWRINNPDKFKDGQLRRSYGITLDEFKSKIASQNGKCNICEKQLDMGKKTHVDHDHKTGKVRGILCNNCNSGLATYERHSKAVEQYLEKHRDVDIKSYIPSHAFLH